MHLKPRTWNLLQVTQNAQYEVNCTKTMPYPPLAVLTAHTNIIRSSQPLSRYTKLPLLSVDIEPKIGSPLKIWPMRSKYPHTILVILTILTPLMMKTLNQTLIKSLYVRSKFFCQDCTRVYLSKNIVLEYDKE